MPEEQKKIQLISVVEHGGTTWQVGSPVPGSTDTKIMKLFMIDGLVEIWALPIPGSELDRLQQGLWFSLMPLSIKIVTGVARFDLWQKLMKETEEAVNAEDEDDEEEEEEDDEAPIPRMPNFASPPNNAPQPLPSGFAPQAQGPQGPPPQASYVPQFAPQAAQPSYVPQLSPQPQPNGQAPAPTPAPSPAQTPEQQ